MITTEIYKGQGLGNQLACYITTRVIALDRRYDFGIMHPERFKCLDFMNLDFGKEVVGGSGPEGGPPKKLPEGIYNYYTEKQIIHPINKSDMRFYDADLVSILDSTKIDGYMQDEKYFEHRKSEIREWLKVKEGCNTQEYSREDICVINFRGGEYVRFKELFLNQKYWDDAVKNMLGINPDMKFIVVTDDVRTARTFFPDFEITHKSIGHDYSIINNAYYLILSNSSFAFFPTWLNQKVKKVIAPKYWARYNVSDGYWCSSQNLTKDFFYQDKEGKLFDYENCTGEYNNYQKLHPEYFTFKESQIINNKKISITLFLKKVIGKLLSHRVKNFLFKLYEK